MEENTMHRNDAEDGSPLSLPQTDRNVYPRQCCPAFVARDGAFPWERECWFCVYADFHLEKACPLDVGICGYPVKRKCARRRLAL